MRPWTSKDIVGGGHRRPQGHHFLLLASPGLDLSGKFLHLPTFLLLHGLQFGLLPADLLEISLDPTTIRIKRIRGGLAGGGPPGWRPVIPATT